MSNDVGVKLTEIRALIAECGAVRADLNDLMLRASDIGLTQRSKLALVNMGEEIFKKETALRRDMVRVESEFAEQVAASRAEETQAGPLQGEEESDVIAGEALAEEVPATPEKRHVPVVHSDFGENPFADE